MIINQKDYKQIALQAKSLITLSCDRLCTGFYQRIKNGSILDTTSITYGNYTIGEFEEDYVIKITCLTGSIDYSVSDYLSSRNEALTWSAKPTAAAFGRGQAWFSDLGSMGYSDGVEWTISKPSNGNYVIPFGDSLTAYMWKWLTPTGNITVSNGIATMTVSANTNAVSGTKFRIALSPTAGYNKVHTVITSLTATSFTFAAPTGAPASETIVNHAVWIDNDTTANASHVNTMRWFSKCRFSIPHNGGVGGDDSGEALLRLNVDLLDKFPDMALILLGTNDALKSTDGSITEFVANMTEIYSKCLAAGIKVDACTIPPFGPTNASAADVNKNRFILAANKWIRDYVNNHADMILHDIHAWSLDQASANGNMISTYTTDGTHFSQTGAWHVGKAMANNYAAVLGAHPDKLPTSQGDGYTFDTSSKNRWLNHMFQGAGPDATSWSTLFQGTGNVKTSSVVARTVNKDGDTFGNNQKIELDSTASGSAGTALVIQDATARLVAGKRYVARAALTITKGSFTTAMPHIYFAFTESGVARVIRAGMPDVFDTTVNDVVLETPEFIYPSGASVQSFYLKCSTTGSANDGVIEWGRAYLEQID